ncbi:MAG TPA: tRNA (adenosine(37)-N6)-dimethylallyltransferase MiaA [Candidatus Paceibacterota bacterium]
MAWFSPRKERRDTLIVIVGPTASGKSDLGVALAQKFAGEVVSADSRQVYRGLDIGSGKITKKEMLGVPHHLLSVASPKRKFSVAQYQKLAQKAIRDIQKRGKLPILVGGTPFYVYAAADGSLFPEVKPNPKLRAELEKLSTEQLLAKLKKLDPERVSTLQQSSGQDKNKRRLIRALEIVITTGKPVPKLRMGENGFRPDLLMIGVKRSPEELKQRIHDRLLERLKHGMINEVDHLHDAGLSWKRLEEFGLEYRDVAKYLQGKISKKEMIENIQKESEDFARRQMVWFKKDPRIHWVSSYPEAKKLVDLKGQQT